MEELDSRFAQVGQNDDDQDNVACSAARFACVCETGAAEGYGIDWWVVVTVVEEATGAGAAIVVCSVVVRVTRSELPQPASKAVLASSTAVRDRGHRVE